jgi:hypothetical protein
MRRRGLFSAGVQVIFDETGQGAVIEFSGLKAVVIVFCQKRLNVIEIWRD